MLEKIFSESNFNSNGYYKKRHHEVNRIRDKKVNDRVTRIENITKVYSLFERTDKAISPSDIRGLSKPTLHSILKKLVFDKFLLKKKIVNDNHYRIVYVLNRNRPVSDLELQFQNRFVSTCRDLYDGNTHLLLLDCISFFLKKYHV